MNHHLTRKQIILSDLAAQWNFRAEMSLLLGSGLTGPGEYRNQCLHRARIAKMVSDTLRSAANLEPL